MEIQKSIIFIEKEKMIMEKFLKEMTNGEYAIVDSKTVILLDKNADFTVCFTFDPDSDVAVRIRFRSDGNKSKYIYRCRNKSYNTYLY